MTDDDPLETRLERSLSRRAATARTGTAPRLASLARRRVARRRRARGLGVALGVIGVGVVAILTWALTDGPDTAPSGPAEGRGCGTVAVAQDGIVYPIYPPGDTSTIVLSPASSAELTVSGGPCTREALVESSDPSTLSGDGTGDDTWVRAGPLQIRTGESTLSVRLWSCENATSCTFEPAAAARRVRVAAPVDPCPGTQAAILQGSERHLLYVFPHSRARARSHSFTLSSSSPATLVVEGGCSDEVGVTSRTGRLGNPSSATGRDRLLTPGTVQFHHGEITLIVDGPPSCAFQTSAGPCLGGPGATFTYRVSVR